MRKDDEYGSELRSYLIGLFLAVSLSAVPFVFVGWHLLPRLDLFWLIAAAGCIQIVAHFRFFLHIDLSKSKRDDLQLILFSTLIVMLMVGGTLWIVSNQYTRMDQMGQPM